MHNYIAQRLRMDGRFATIESVVVCPRHADLDPATRVPLPALKGTGIGQIVAMVQTDDPCQLCAKEKVMDEVAHETAQRGWLRKVTDAARKMTGGVPELIGEYCIYVAGPMSGLPDHNKPAFHRMERMLSRHGFGVLSPAHYNGEHTYEWYMEQDIAKVLAANAVVFLRGWRKSKGAKTEHQVANITGRLICYEQAP